MKIKNIILYIWGWLYQPFTGVIGMMLNVMFRAVIVYIIPLIITENPDPSNPERFIWLYAILSIIWVLQPIAHSINSIMWDWKYHRREVEEE